MPIGYQPQTHLDKTNPPPNCRCNYCGRSWDPTKYESCPGCGAPQTEVPSGGVRVMEVPDKVFFVQFGGEIVKIETFRDGTVRKSFNVASVPSMSIAPVSAHGRKVIGRA